MIRVMWSMSDGIIFRYRMEKETWMEPYLNSNIGVYMISYVIPIEVDGESIGIIGMDIDFSEFTDTIDSLSIFDSGYGFLLKNLVRSYLKDLEIGSNLADADSDCSQ